MPDQLKLMCVNVVKFKLFFKLMISICFVSKANKVNLFEGMCYVKILNITELHSARINLS